jgi:hypothetical protein
VNGDGYSDVIVGANAFDNGETNEGRAFCYYGNDGDGLDRTPRQARADGTAPIDLLGWSDAQTSFRLRALGRTSLARISHRRHRPPGLGGGWSASGGAPGSAWDAIGVGVERRALIGRRIPF